MVKMLIVVYSGSSPHRISSLLDDHHAGGYTEFRNAHGAGVTGKREGSRAWPGESTLFFSVVPADRSVDLVNLLREEQSRLPAGDRMHVAVLPAETFF
jgi:hypothetical protein